MKTLRIILGLLIATIPCALAIGPIGGGTGLADVVSDATPQLGGNLDLNTFAVSGTNVLADFGITDAVAVADLGAGWYAFITADSANVLHTVTDPGYNYGLYFATGDPTALVFKLDTSGTLSGNSDTAVATQKATKTYADTKVSATAIPVVIGIAASDETTTITTGTAKATFRMPYAMTVTAVRASVTTASSSGLPTVDINEAGTTILSTKLTLDASEKTSTTAATAAVLSDTALADDAEITIDFDVAGTGAAGVKVWLIGTR